MVEYGLEYNCSGINRIEWCNFRIGFSIWRDYLLKNKELIHKELEYQRDYEEKYLMVPIIEFIDDLLRIMNNAVAVSSASSEIRTTSQSYT